MNMSEHLMSAFILVQVQSTELCPAPVISYKFYCTFLGKTT